MKKSLIALAALAAVSAASAQSSVTLYGVVDIGYGAQKTQSRDGTYSSRSSGVMDGANAGNRIGFRGTEDLGGGLKANFVVEQGISPTSSNSFAQRNNTAGQQGTNQYPGATSPATVQGSVSGFSTSTNRQSYVGLSSDSIGTVNIGYQYTIGYELATLSGYNIGSEGAPGAYTAHLIGTSYAGSTRSNGLSYISPAFGGGFTVRAQYGALGATQETSTATTAGATTAQATGRRYALMGQYANGPLSAALAYTNVRATSVVNTPASAALNAAGVAVVTAASTNANQANRVGNLVQLGASYDFGVVKLAGTYNTGRDGGTALTTTSSRYRGYQVGLSAPFGAIVPFVTVGRAYTLLDGSTTGRSADVNQAQIGVRYSLSKRTTAYAFYGRTADNAAAATAAYKDTKTIVGVAHSF